jgi:hypothetical protein
MFKTIISFLLLSALVASCGPMEDSQQKSDSGVTKASTQVQTDANGKTIEQENIIERLKRDNSPGSIKHLYIISSYTGDVLQYSTVKGKVTSGSKRLSPKTVNGVATINASYYTNPVTIGGERMYTDEVLDDGGAYGESGNYMFWFDAAGNYQQYYPAGGTYVSISDKPMRIRKANYTITLEEPTPAKQNYEKE